MKFATVAKSMALGFALLFTASAFAGTRASLQLISPATVNGTQLKAGDYKIEWEGNGPNVEVSILRGKNVVAKVPAHLVELGAPAAYSAAVVKKNGDGTSTLSGVRFEGKKFSLEIGDSGDGMQAGSSK